MSNKKLWEENTLDDALERNLDEMIEERILFDKSAMDDARHYAKLVGRGARRIKHANYKE
jgi:hypothetical protein